MARNKLINQNKAEGAEKKSGVGGMKETSLSNYFSHSLLSVLRLGFHLINLIRGQAWKASSLF